jgi:hypothetical protein
MMMRETWGGHWARWVGLAKQLSASFQSGLSGFSVKSVAFEVKLSYKT